MKLSVVALLALCTVCAAFASSFEIAGEATPPEPALAYHVPPGLPVVVTANYVCRLVADNPSAADATVLGVDGAPSVEVNGTDYWFFGDTFREGPGGRRDVIPAGFATTTDLDGHDCVDLTFKTDSHDVVQPMFPRGSETTAWPDGVLRLPDGRVLFYMVKTFRSSPTEWGVGAIGLGMLPAGSVTGQRLVEKIWDQSSGFPGRLSGARSPVVIGDEVFVYINTDAGNFLGRAPLARIGDAAAYTYWDGGAWTPQPAHAQALWPRQESVLPADNGLYVSFDSRIGKWIAVYNADLWSIKVRTADAPWGPWSSPLTWFDCRAIWGAQYPYCYSTALHSELSLGDPSTLFATFSTEKPYDVALAELHLGVGIHAWTDGDGAVRYAAASPDPSYSDAGVAFYASDVSLAGLVPVYEEQGDDGYTYSLIPRSFSARIAFYAYAADAINEPVHTRPVYRWQRNGRAVLDPEDREGWQRGEIAFYVPCLDVARDGASGGCTS